MASSDGDRTTGNDESVLVVFVRDPEPGRVKTRLARAIGDAAATAFYTAFVADLTRRFAAAPFAVRWAVAPPDAPATIAVAPCAGFAARFALPASATFEQQGGDLGERMLNTFAAMRHQGFARCAIIGSDMPQLALATVHDALARLDDADLVLGPADDGGYYLIAARGPLDVFDGVAWGTDRVLVATRARAERLDLATVLLAPDFDVDVVADLERLRVLLQRDPAARAAMPATAAALDALPRGRR